MRRPSSIGVCSYDREGSWLTISSQGQQPPQGQYPPQQQQGYPPQQQQQQYGQQPQYGGQSAGPQEVAAYKQALQQTVQEKRLQAFYPPNSPVLDQIAARASAQVDRLCQQWRINKEIGNDIVKLALYDIVLYIGKSRRDRMHG